jgi:hypothetical protein
MEEDLKMLKVVSYQQQLKPKFANTSNENNLQWKTTKQIKEQYLSNLGLLSFLVVLKSGLNFIGEINKKSQMKS